MKKAFNFETKKGKSLSLICGSLKWLNDFKKNQKSQLDKLISDEEKEKKRYQNID